MKQEDIFWKVVAVCLMGVAVILGLLLHFQNSELAAAQIARLQQKAVLDSCTNQLQKETADAIATFSTGTVLTESQTVAQPLSLFGGLLQLQPGPGVSPEQAVPVWIVPAKVQPRLYAVGRANHVYYWIDTKTRKIEGPFAPIVQPAQ
jgi:hypothetical protein